MVGGWADEEKQVEEIDKNTQAAMHIKLQDDTKAFIRAEVKAALEDSNFVRTVIVNGLLDNYDVRQKIREDIYSHYDFEDKIKHIATQNLSNMISNKITDYLLSGDSNGR